MFILMGILNCVLVIESAPAANKNDSYLLATILFYKDINGKIVLATGPVPKAAVDVVMDDVKSRIDGANVTIAPIFKSPQDIPEAVDVMDYIKDAYGTVFVTEAFPKKNSRTRKDEKWNSDLIGFLRTDSRKTNSRLFALALGYTDEQDNYIRKPTNINNGSGDCKLRLLQIVSNSSNIIPTKSSIIPTKPAITPTKPRSIPTKSNVTPTKPSIVRTKKRTVKPAVKTSRNTSSSPGHEDAFSEFIPNGIYYGIHKKCVNWANACNSLNALDKPSNQFNNVQSYLMPVPFYP